MVSPTTPRSFKRSFKARLQKPDGTGTWNFCTLPFSAPSVFGVRGRIPVLAAVNGISYRSSLMPAGNGTHYLVVSREIRERAGANQGDTVRVTIEQESPDIVVEVPADLAKAFKKNAVARRAFAVLSHVQQKRHVDGILQAKTEETRARRVEKAIESLEKGSRPR